MTLSKASSITMPSLSHGSDALKLHQNYLFFIIYSITLWNDAQTNFSKMMLQIYKYKTSTTHTWNFYRKYKNEKEKRDREEESDLVYEMIWHLTSSICNQTHHIVVMLMFINRLDYTINLFNLYLWNFTPKTICLKYTFLYLNIWEIE